MRCRVAIVGAGPAGTATALYLVRRGVDPGDVAVLDRAVFPRPKLCGGAVTYRGTLRLAELGVGPEGSAATRGLSLEASFGRVSLCEPGPQRLYDRARLDHDLVRACRGAGLTVHEGAAVTAIDRTRSGWRLQTGGAIFESEWLVGADGAASATARRLAVRRGPTARALEGIYASDRADEWLRFHFGPLEAGIPGYAWVFPFPNPEGRNLYKVGIIDMRGRVPAERLRAWLAAYTAAEGYTCEAPVTGWPEHLFSWRNVAHRPGLVLVGEAYGVDPLLGEGIACALETAAYAARRLKGALDRGSRRLPGYEGRFLLSEEGANLVFQSALADALYGPNGERWLRRFFASRAGKGLPSSGKAIYGRLLRRAGSLLPGILRAGRK